MLNRTQAPALIDIHHIQFVAPEKHEIAPGVSLYHMAQVTDETCRIELYFDAGKVRGTDGIPGFVNGLLLSGTPEMTSVQIHEKINGLGGFFESGMSLENAFISVFCLREYAVQLFDILHEAISHVSFDEKEVAELLSDRRQKWKISMEKVNFLAQREFQKTVMASDPDYASVTEVSDFDKATIPALRAFHEKHYKKGLSKVVIVGNLDAATIEHIRTTATSLTGKTDSQFTRNLANQKGEFIFEKEGAMQTAIRVGRALFNKKHPDYLDFLVLHTILGDYFGSRLMSNIREDKGYTYGIGTMLYELRDTGYFMAATEVRKDVRDDTLREIRYEFERLQEEPVDHEELELVKNYMLGQLLKSADGPYAMTDLFISAEMHGEGLEFYNRALENLHRISPERIRELAQKYLRWDDMTVVAFG